MGKRPIFYNALLLTGVNLLLRLVATSFQVYLSGCIGAAGIGLLQLVLSVTAMATTAGMAGIRTATMYLTAEELGKGTRQNIRPVLSACFSYSLCFSLAVAAVVIYFAPMIATVWVGDPAALPALRLAAACLPVTCLAGVMTGYFTAAGRISTLAAVEVAEQVCALLVTVILLTVWAGEDRGRACCAVILGGGAGSVMTLGCLVLLRLRERAKCSSSVSVRRRLLETALPLAVADDLKVGINTVENLMVPKRLALYTRDALASFGTVCGMVFPVLMFPAAILYALADLLIPELARCNAAGSRRRIRYLVRRSLKVALLYGAACGGVLYLAAGALCARLYQSSEAGHYLRQFALLAPMLYADAIMDAVNKGLGKQKISVRINILTSVLDVLGLFVLLPRWGMQGYFVSFFITHAINAWLSLRLLQKVTGLHLSFGVAVSVVAAMLIALLMFRPAPWIWVRLVGFGLVFMLLLHLWGVLGWADLQWLRSLTGIAKKEGIFEK